MPGPIDPRLLKRARATKNYLVAGVIVGCITAILTIVQAWLLSHSIGEIFDTTQSGNPVLSSLNWAVPGLLLIFGAKAALAWLNTWLAQRTAAAVKSQLRRDILAARLRRPCEAGTSTSTLMTLITQGLDALDGYFSKYLPQLALAMTVPFIVGTAVLTTDFWSALIVALTLPLIPFMMALVGWTTEKATAKRWKVQTRLAGHFADLVEGLPTLQVFGRAKAQIAGLRHTEAAHVRETMAVLRISFLSALVLELLATLSVAIVAVTIGFRVLYGEMDLTTSLFVLILAPEIYLPVRQVGVHYHDSADGVAAAESAFAVIEAGAEKLGGNKPAPNLAQTTISASQVSYYYPEQEALKLKTLGKARAKEAPVAPTKNFGLEPISFTVKPGDFCVLMGPSGGGKTTLLNLLMGFLKPSSGELKAGDEEISDFEIRSWQSQIAFVGQNPGLLNGDIADNLRLADPQATEAELRQALDAAGGKTLTLEHRVGDLGQGLSAGERRRVALARALLFIAAGKRNGKPVNLMLLDEPTAGLDAATEEIVLKTLLAQKITVVIISHRLAVQNTATQQVEIGQLTNLV